MSNLQTYYLSHKNMCCSYQILNINLGIPWQKQNISNAKDIGLARRTIHLKKIPFKNYFAKNQNSIGMPLCCHNTSE